MYVKSIEYLKVLYVNVPQFILIMLITFAKRLNESFIFNSKIYIYI